MEPASISANQNPRKLEKNGAISRHENRILPHSSIVEEGYANFLLVRELIVKHYK